MSLVTPTARGYMPVVKNFLVPLNTVTPTRSVPAPAVITPSAFVVGSATDITTTGFTLSWIESDFADQYKVDYGSGYTFYTQNSPITITTLPVNLVGEIVTVTAISSTGTTTVGTGTPYVALLGYATPPILVSVTRNDDGSECDITWVEPVPLVGDAYAIRMTRPANAYYPALSDYYFASFLPGTTTYTAGVGTEFLGYNSEVTVETIQVNNGLSIQNFGLVAETSIYYLVDQDFGTLEVGSTFTVTGFVNPTLNGTFTVVSLVEDNPYWTVRVHTSTQNGDEEGLGLYVLSDNIGPSTAYGISNMLNIQFPYPLPTIPTATIVTIGDTTVDGTFVQNEVPGEYPTYYIVFSPSSGVAAYIDESKGTWNATGLTPETEYTFTIYAYITQTRFSEYTSDPFTTLPGLPTLVLNSTPVTNTKDSVVLSATPYPIDTRYIYQGYIGNTDLSQTAQDVPASSEIWFGWGPGNIPAPGTPVVALIRVTDPISKQHKDSNAIAFNIGS